MRVLIAAFRPKKSVHGLFCMFRLTPPVRANSYLAERSDSAEHTSCGLCHCGQRSCEATPGECSAFSVGHLRGGSAARAGPPRRLSRVGTFNLIRKAQPFVPVFSPLSAQDIRPERLRLSKTALRTADSMRSQRLRLCSLYGFPVPTTLEPDSSSATNSLTTFSICLFWILFCER